MSSKLPHDSAHTHVTGESEYVDDRPFTHGELHLGVVFSLYAHAKIKKIDFSEALEIPGVVAVYTSKDFPHNRWGTIFQDQPLVAEEVVQFAGESVAIVAAEDPTSLRRGIKAVRVDYQKLPPILSVTEAIKKQSFIGSSRCIHRGDIVGGLKASPLRLTGEIIIKGADHFYLESQASLAYPREDGQIEIHTSSQHPTEVQHVVAHALGLDSKDVVCIVKRMGGAFGGKESQGAPFAAYAAMAAQKLKRPVRIILSKDDDMIMTGKRNPFENTYEVGFSSKGEILALDVNLYSDGGAYADLSTAIMERAMLHCDNAYYIPDIRIQGQVCKTNFHPHTAFRGFGGPKGVATIEKIIEEIAHKLKLDPLEVRRMNCYPQGADTTPYGQKVENNLLPNLFETLERKSSYRERRRKLKEHNEGALMGEADFLRGISLTAVKFGISFTTRFLNQGNALVHIHRDGTLQVSTGATEMGQGVYARIADLVAEELGLARSKVRIMPTSTDKNANTSPTAASSGTDINGAAALIAVRKIKDRLSQLAAQLLNIPEERWAVLTAGLGTQAEIEVKNTYLAQLPNDSADWETGIANFHDIIFEDGSVFNIANPEKRIPFQKLVNEAYLNRISLSDYAHYRFQGLNFNKLTGQGNAFLYFTQGVAASEVSVDLFTGEVKVLRTDILMDLGRPINEGLDLGQVTGGFIQGMGWVTTENLFYSPDGLLLSHSPSTYKIPNIQDTPREFNVELLANDSNYANLKGTKAVGEPPLLLSISVWTAIQDALKDLPQYKEQFPQIQLPATQEVVLRAIMPKAFEQ